MVCYYLAHHLSSGEMPTIHAAIAASYVARLTPQSAKFLFQQGLTCIVAIRYAMTPRALIMCTLTVGSLFQDHELDEFLMQRAMQVIGKVAQTGAERILGTFVGGSLGFLTYVVGRTFWDPDTRSDGARLLALSPFICHACNRPFCVTWQTAVSARRSCDVVHELPCR